jgi:hypothetical protein
VALAIVDVAIAPIPIGQTAARFKA